MVLFTFKTEMLDGCKSSGFALDGSSSSGKGGSGATGGATADSSTPTGAIAGSSTATSNNAAFKLNELDSASLFVLTASIWSLL
jgi:hypothetical protein